jgi:hypothetical protein
VRAAEPAGKSHWSAEAITSFQALPLSVANPVLLPRNRGGYRRRKTEGEGADWVRVALRIDNIMQRACALSCDGWKGVRAA